MNVNKTEKEIASDITIAWIQAKAHIQASGMKNLNDPGVPEADEVSEFFKSVYNAIYNS